MKILRERNGSANFNEEHFIQKYKSSIVAHKKLEEMGVTMRLVNSDLKKKEEMYTIIDEEIAKWKR